MKWIKFDLAISPDARKDHIMEYLSEGKAFLYGGKRLGSFGDRRRDSWIGSLNENENLMVMKVNSALI